MQSGREHERESFYADILSMAIEAGTFDNATLRWAEVHEYHWYSPDLPGGDAEPAPHGGGNAWALISATAVESDLLPPAFNLSPRVIAGAYKLLARQDYDPTRRVGTDFGTGVLPIAEWRDRMLAARRVHDAGVLTEDDADMLIQLGLFGAVLW